MVIMLLGNALQDIPSGLVAVKLMIPAQTLRVWQEYTSSDLYTRKGDAATHKPMQGSLRQGMLSMPSRRCLA